MSERHAPINCKGCASIIGTKKSCLFDGYSDKCPCVRCIIKMMCSEPCGNFNNFRNDVLNKRWDTND